MSRYTLCELGAMVEPMKKKSDRTDNKLLVDLKSIGYRGKQGGQDCLGQQRE